MPKLKPSAALVWSFACFWHRFSGWRHVTSKKRAFPVSFFFLLLPFFSSCTEETPKRLYQLSAATCSADNDDSSLPARAFWGVYVSPLKEKKKKHNSSRPFDPADSSVWEQIHLFPVPLFWGGEKIWSWDSQDFCRTAVFFFDYWYQLRREVSNEEREGWDDSSLRRWRGTLGWSCRSTKQEDIHALRMREEKLEVGFVCSFWAFDLYTEEWKWVALIKKKRRGREDNQEYQKSVLMGPGEQAPAGGCSKTEMWNN